MRRVAMNPLTPRFNEGVRDGELSLIELFQQFTTRHWKPLKRLEWVL